GRGLASLRRGVSDLRGELAEMRETLGRELSQLRGRSETRIEELAAAHAETRRELEAARAWELERERERESEGEREKEAGGWPSHWLAEGDSAATAEPVAAGESTQTTEEASD